MQKALMEQNKLENQIDNSRREFYSQKNNLISAHTEEKEILIKVLKQYFRIFPFSFLFYLFLIFN